MGACDQMLLPRSDEAPVIRCIVLKVRLQQASIEKR
jgi:hypothetical protein